MANHALAVLEDALRARKLDRTLTTAIPPGKGDGQVAPTALAGLDAGLHGGLPRGQLSEIAGSRSSGRTTLLLQVLAAATRRGEIAALVDTFDRLDLASVVSAGIALNRLLWIRGQAITNQLPPRYATEVQKHGAHVQSDPISPCLRVWHPTAQTRVEVCAAGTPPAGAFHQSGLLDRTIERALKALNLVLQAGGFGVVAIDFADAPPAALNRIPFTTWLRVQRTIEGSDTACVLVGAQPLARSAGGVTLSLAGRAQWAGQESSGPGARDSGLGTRGSGPGASSRSRRLAGMDVTVRVVSPRRRVDGEITIGARVHECSGGIGSVHGCAGSPVHGSFTGS